MRRITVGVVLVVALVVAVAPIGEASGPVPTTVTCGFEVTRSILVANSLFGCPESGLIVKKPNVTIDLGGNTIDGNGTDDLTTAEVGVSAGGWHHVVVRNGTVSDFEEGVTVFDDGRITHVTATRNSLSGLQGFNKRVVISGSTAFDNGAYGIIAVGYNQHLLSNRTWGNATAGIRSLMVGGLLRSNLAWGESIGIVVDPLAVDGAKTVLARNRAFGNTLYGFRVHGPARLIGNSAIANGLSGFDSEWADANYVRNVARGNGLYGFQMFQRAQMTRNSASGNKAGFFFTASADDSVVEANRSSGNQEDGFSSAADGVVLRENAAQANGGNGFDLSAGAGQTLVDNTAHINGYVNGVADQQGLGFRVDGSVTNLTAGNNHAWGNDGLFVQCSAAAACVATNKPAGLPKVVTCGYEVTGSITVANSLFDCPLDGLTVSSNDVTIDLGGNTIEGNAADDDPTIKEAGVANRAYDDVVIRNGLVRRFESGVFSDTNLLAKVLFRVRVERVIAWDNTQTGIRVAGVDSRITKAFALENLTDGFSVTGRFVVSRSTALGNTKDGFQCGSRGTVLGNVSSGNVQDGFDCSGLGPDASPTLLRNIASGNGVAGFAFTLGSCRTLEGNAAIANTGVGVWIPSGDPCRVRGNRATGNGNDAFLIESSNNIIEENRATGNDGAGIRVAGSEQVIRGNRVAGNRSYGFFVEGDGHRLTRNVARGAASAGIYLLSGNGQLVKKNVASRNGFFNGESNGSGLGIYVDAAVTNLTANGNVARGNDDPAECSAAAHCN